MSTSTVQAPRKTVRDGTSTQLAALGNLNEKFQSCKLTLTSNNMAFTFASKGLQNMKDRNYRVFVHGEFAAATRVDESTITTAGFSIIGGANGEVAHIMVHGVAAGD